jgi:hypothetical protein
MAVNESHFRTYNFPTLYLQSVVCRVRVINFKKNSQSQINVLKLEHDEEPVVSSFQAPGGPRPAGGWLTYAVPVLSWVGLWAKEPPPAPLLPPHLYFFHSQDCLRSNAGGCHGTRNAAHPSGVPGPPRPVRGTVYSQERLNRIATLAA